jgi:hypothetical protein
VALASKPSLLSTSIESLAEYSASPVPYRRVSQVCLCRPSRKMSHHRSNWGYFSFSYRISNVRRHLRGCPFSRIDDETQATSFTVEFSGLRRLFQTAVVLSFAHTRGAGGRSISPTFTYYPTIDESTAPAFRTMALASKLVADRSVTDMKEVARVLQCCYENILTLYSRGKASPKDINSKGESLIHLIAQTVVKVRAYIYNKVLNEY